MPATHQGIGSAYRLSIQERAAILALNWHAGWSFPKIGEKLGISMQTAHQVVQRAKVSLPGRLPTNLHT